MRFPPLAGPASVLAAALAATVPAQAAYTVTFSQSGSDVVATGGGAIDISGLARRRFPRSRALREPLFCRGGDRRDKHH